MDRNSVLSVTNVVNTDGRKYNVRTDLKKSKQIL